MISYRKFWARLSECGISQKELRYQYGISSQCIRALKQDLYVRTGLLDRLCVILDCPVSALLEQVKNDDELPEFIYSFEETRDQKN